MMGALGVHLDSEGDGPEARNTTYKPETCMNYEVGGRLAFSGGGHRLTAGVSAFYLRCRNQQITVFPPGKGTGRMMANAGRSRSCGVEAEFSWAWKGLSVQASGSILNAVFKEYNDGRNDYSGNVIPYSPSSTLFALAAYSFVFGHPFFRNLEVSVDVAGTGKIVWDEAGEFSQDPYYILGAGLRLGLPHSSVYLRGANLTGTEYDTFYFKSVGNSFFQRGKPFRVTIGVDFEF